MLVGPGFIQCFDALGIAEHMLKNKERFRVWQVDHLRTNYRPDQLSISMQNFLDGKSSPDIYPKKGRPPAVLTDKKLKLRVGIMIDYPVFLAEERARTKESPKPEGSARERACKRIAVKYGFWRAPRTLPDLMTKWRKDEMFMRILERHRANLIRKVEPKDAC